jgi:hypothetical protein
MIDLVRAYLKCGSTGNLFVQCCWHPPDRGYGKR